MEQSLTSLTYKGSIPEAITEAKKQRKLFVVYISGKNDESSRLENSTWTDLNVADSVEKYCILLHIPEESTDAANFSAIYPQKSVPCITAIGYNGVQLWQNEGFLSAEALASSLEKAWLGLHIQSGEVVRAKGLKKCPGYSWVDAPRVVLESLEEDCRLHILIAHSEPKETTATVLSAALASNKSEPSTSGVPNAVSTGEESSSSKAVISDQGSSSSTAVESPLIDTNVQSPDAVDAASDTVMKHKGRDCKIESSSSTKSAQGVHNVAMEDLNKSGGDIVNPVAEGSYSGPEKTTVNHSGVSGEGSQAVSNVKSEVVQVDKGEAEDDKKVDTFENCTRVSRSSDVNLNIRLPNGVSLKEKFSITSTMRMVKDYVDENQGSGIGNYDLAIPYPRKIFCDQDLSKSLSDLGLFDRQALIVVPRQKGTNYLSGKSAFSDQTDSRNTVSSSDGSNGGYFSYAKRFLSYFNPLSYLGGGASSSSSGQQSENGTWEYSPNPTRRNSVTQNASTSGKSEEKKSRKPPASGFGSNIHTLKRDEDDERFSDRNSFWNGNSTEYGGNDDSK
ncbi:hypothetical protein ACFX2F_032033 [Malus domestica]